VSAPAAGAVALPSSLTIAEVGALKAALEAALGSGDPITLDARSVARVDAAGVQLLVAFAAEAARRGRRWTWAGFSATLAEVSERLDLARALALPASPTR
jgi:anti-anti-sigma regulatory factor